MGEGGRGKGEGCKLQKGIVPARTLELIDLEPSWKGSERSGPPLAWAHGGGVSAVEFEPGLPDSKGSMLSTFPCFLAEGWVGLDDFGGPTKPSSKS